jgi:SAM-dependent methyltransferase
VSRSRARSFGAVAAAYAEHRPGYPDAAVDWALSPPAGTAPPTRPGNGRPRLLDLAAGTGKLTSALLGRGEVVAVEPDAEMLGELRRRFPSVDAREGSAESIPLPAVAVDAVLVGQAWHWFDAERALPEIARVLRPGGVLAALWNTDDTEVEWVTGLHRVSDERRVPGLVNSGIPPRFVEHEAFGPEQAARFPNPVRTTAQGLLANLATHSWALLSEPADRDATFARMRDYLARRPETSSGEFVLPMLTEVLRVSRR